MKLRLAAVLASTLFHPFILRPAVAEPQPAPVAHAKPATAQPPVAGDSLFDPSRHMRVSEVRAGMKGYGLSVFSGTKIERFDVEVISVLNKFNPGGDVVLIKCKGMNLEHTGAVAGMSGSPVYLKDDQGRERMIGAFAYGWPLTKDPLAGVQPIEYMLRIPAASKNSPINSVPAAGGASGVGAAAPHNRSRGAKLRCSLTDSPYYPRLNFDAARTHARRAAGERAGLGANAGGVQLRPLATPLMTSGLSPRMLEQVAPLFEMMGLTPLQAGGGGGGGSLPPGQATPKLEPGSVMAVPMILGDSEMTAIGTTTEVIGGRVFGFGHPFNNEGPVALPMGTGRVGHIIPNLQTSFKLGFLHEQVGRLTADQQVGVAGEMGQSPPMVPIDYKIVYADGSPPRSFHFDGALHPRFTPLICGVSLMSALSGAHDLPQYNTLDYDVTLEFSNGQTVRVKNRAVNTSPMEVFAEIGMPLMTAADNPFERVLVKRVTGTFHVSGEAKDAQVVEVNMPKSRFRPGETIRGFVTYKPFRGEESILPIELQLPADLREGDYKLVVSDYRRYMQDEQQSRPFRFTAEKVEELFDVLRDVTAVRRDALYLRLVRQPDGVAIGRTAMPQLPSSRRTVLMGAGRSNTTRFVSSTVKAMPVQFVMTGASEFTITVDPKAKVGVGKPGPVRLDADEAAAPAEPVVPKAAPAGPTPDAGKLPRASAD